MISMMFRALLSEIVGFAKLQQTNSIEYDLFSLI